MDIKDLSPELQELVHRRQIEQGNDGTFDGDLSFDKEEGNFRWANTKERGDFWDKVYNGRMVVIPKPEFLFY